MYVKPDKKELIKPLIISHGADSGFNSQFIWTGKYVELIFRVIRVQSHAG